MNTIERNFRIFVNNLDKVPQENFVHVDLAFLKKYDLMNFHQKTIDLGLTRYFQVFESIEKITLINEEFVVWIVPETIAEKSVTYTIVALNKEDEPKLELVFLLSGVYNSSQLVLKILDKVLQDVEETESIIKKLA